MSNQPSVFENFTNQYALNKTLRFELRPVGNTQKMLDEEDVFKKDEIIQEKYQKTKPFFDKLHREFVEEALSEITLIGLDKYIEILKELQKDRKNRDIQKKIEIQTQHLRSQIKIFFDKKAEDWTNNVYPELGLKNRDTEFLFEERIFEVLKARYGKDEQTLIKNEGGEELISIFDEWKGFTGYFTKFQATRKNFYKDDGTSTALATRIVDQNLKRFCENLDIFDTLRKKKIDMSEVEINFNISLQDIFEAEYYNSCVLQDGINFYNKILGGEVKENGEKLKGLNEIINKYRQDNKNEKISFFKLLDKQILSEKEKFLKAIEGVDQLKEVLNEFYRKSEEKISSLEKLFINFIQNNRSYDLTEIYISREAFNTICHRWTNKIKVFEMCLHEVMKSDKLSKYKKEDDSYAFPDFIALEYLKKALESEVMKEEKQLFWKSIYYKSPDNENGFLTQGDVIWTQFLKIFEHEFSLLFVRVVNEGNTDEKEIGYVTAKKQLKTLLEKENLSIDKESKITIKDFADSVLKIYQMGKYFAVEKKRQWDDTVETGEFYDNPDFGYKIKFYDNSYEEIVQKYNDIRNYLTKKPYSEEKWKINFECSYLLSGWSSDFNTCGTLLFQKDGIHYLGVIKGTSLDLQKRKKLIEGITEKNVCKKMVYDFQKPDNKNVPRIFIRSKGDKFAPAVKDLNLPVESILDIYDRGLFKTENKDSEFFKDSLIKLIDYFKLGFSRHGSYKHFSFKWKESSEYKNISEFYEDTIRFCYEIRSEDLNFDEVKKLAETGKMYLFKIYNKDFSEKSTGLKNLHTLYFQTLFLKENLENKDGVIFKLSGNGEIFFRPKTDAKKLGERIPKKGSSITKNKRYAEDKLFLHFPIEVNYARSKEGNFNDRINHFLSINPSINILGIDRGEKHLAYYSIIDQRGNILRDKETGESLCASLNVVNKINYGEKLEENAKNREKARQDWQDIEGIKNLKKGYISHVVHKLADLAIKHNAIIVLEDLNMGFKQVRSGIEKSVYQHLEKALIEKLNFLVNKGEKDSERAGHLLRAYQLTDTFTTFKEMGKQTGIIFYTQASYTSKTCPQCGFRKNLGFYFENKEKAEKEIQKLVNFSYDDHGKMFKIDYRLSDFGNERSREGKTRENVLYENTIKKDSFSIYTDTIRYKWRNKIIKEKDLKPGESIHSRTEKGSVLEYDITKCIIGLFERNGVDYRIDNLQHVIVKNSLPAEFYKDLYYYLFLLMNTRNGVSGTEIDEIQCPSCHFSSNDNFQGHIYNADANGAYNIARKGIMILEKINKFKNDNGAVDKMNWGDLFIGIDEWDKFSQKNG